VELHRAQTGPGLHLVVSLSSTASLIPLRHDRPADRRRFLDVSRRLYRHDPLWVAPLDSELHRVLGPDNPFFAHADLQLWIAHRDGQDCGRIAATEDRTHNAIHGERTAFFGFFESIDCPDTARTLLNAAAEWAHQRGLEQLRGPMNPSINDECGLLVSGFDDPPALMMSYNPPGYATLLEGAGFTKVKDLLAFRINVAQAPAARLRRLRQELTRRHPEVQLRPISRASLAGDVPHIKRIYNEAWERNWGAVPLTDAEIDFLVERLQPLLVDGLVWIAESGTEPVGFLLALPDFNEALQPLRGRLLSPGLLRALPYLFGWKRPKRIRLVALGVRREFRGRGIEATLLAGALEASQRDGYSECEASWVLEDNTAVHRLVRVFGGQPGKIYRIFGRTSAPVFSRF